MFKLTRVVMILALLLAAGLSVVSAQEAEGVIATFEGEMTEDEYEFEFTFEAEEGQVIAALFKNLDESASIVSPILRLENPAGDIIADTNNSFSFLDISLFAEINSSGTYTLMLSRYDEEDGTDVGEFAIEVVEVPSLEAGGIVEGSLSSEGSADYYAVSADGAWGVSYVKGDGDMDIALSVNSVDSQSGTLTELATVEGEALTEAVLGIFETDDTYIIQVGQPFAFFSFDGTTSDYTIELVSFE